MDDANRSMAHSTNLAPPIPPRSPRRPRMHSIRTSLKFHIDDLIDILNHQSEHDSENIEGSSALVSPQSEAETWPEPTEAQDCPNSGSSSLPASSHPSPIVIQRAKPEKQLSKPYLRYTHPTELNHAPQASELISDLPRHLSVNNRFVRNPGHNYHNPRHFTYCARHSPSLGEDLYSQVDYEAASHIFKNTSSREQSHYNSVRVQPVRTPVNNLHSFQHQPSTDCAMKSYFDTSSVASSEIDSRLLKHKLRWIRKPRNVLRWLKTAFSLSEEEKAAFKARRDMGCGDMYN